MAMCMPISILNIRCLEQQGRCGICGTDADLVVDHDHVTSRVRGILCRRCNRTLGQFEDDRELLRRALDWLEER